MTGREEIRIVENTKANRLQIFFPLPAPGKSGKFDPFMRSRLSAYGFRAAPSIRAWQRNLTDKARIAAKLLLSEAA